MSEVKTIDKLTPEQEALLPVYTEKWIKIGTNTDPADFDAACKYIKEAYKKAELKPPQYFIGPVNNPYEGALAEYVLKQVVKDKIEFRDKDHPDAPDYNEYIIKEVHKLARKEIVPDGLSISGMAYGSSEYWLSYYNYVEEVLDIPLEVLTPLVDLAKVCGWWTPLQNVAIIQHRPKAIHLDDRQRPHNANGPAIEFRGWGEIRRIYVYHGVRITKKIVDRDYTWQDIENETNAEVRRVMIELYGQDKYLIDSGAEKVHSDDFGTLYRKELEGDEPLMMVKVINSSPERNPDGSIMLDEDDCPIYKEYFIRVNPNAYGGLKTARAAVASTFCNIEDGSMIFESPEDYQPIQQT